MSTKSDYEPMSVFTEAFPEKSGNEVNGLGETEHRRASPFFWHPPPKQTHGKLQQVVTEFHRQSPEIRKVFSPNAPGGRGPKPEELAPEPIEKLPAQWTQLVKRCALEHEAEMVGVAAMQPDWVYEGYAIEETWVIVVGVVMDYDELSQMPPTLENPTAAVVVGKDYNRAARSCREVANYILGQGHYAKAYQGPYASALNMLPAAIAAGFGELGKHGSLINAEHGSAFRLSAVTTSMPLVPDEPDVFGGDDYCMRCQACARACPPGAIANEKQLVRGVEKWYVDFDKCIPYFGEALGCAICLAKCPWSRPGNAPRILQSLAKRAVKSR